MRHPDHHERASVQAYYERLAAYAEAAEPTDACEWESVAGFWLCRTRRTLRDLVRHAEGDEARWRRAVARYARHSCGEPEAGRL